MTTEGRKVVKTLRQFSTFHRDLVRMREWLLEQGITHVAMEATGEYWKPVYEILEGSFELLLANPQHVKNVPGRKTDSRTQNGWPGCYGMVYCGPASFLRS